MPLRPDDVEAIAFDSFSTIVDVHTAEEPLSEYVDDPARVSRLWRTYVWRYRPLCNFIGYVPHHEINRQALEYVLGVLDVDATDEEIDEIARVYYEMAPFEDTRPGMERLADAGYDLYVLSNGDPPVLDAMVENAGIEDLLAGVISADEIQTYKPHVRLYKHAARRAGTPAEDMAMASAAWADVQGAMYAGMRGAWINREDEPPGLRPFDGDPDLEVGTFHGLADHLGA